MLLQELERRDGGAARPVAHDGDAGAGEEVGGAGRDVGRDGTQCKGVADRHLALQAGRFGALGDRPHLGDAAVAAVMQMDVDADTVLAGNAEDRVEMAVLVAVDADGIEPAHQVGTLGDRCVQQFGGARRAAHAALREGHDLDRDEVAEAFAHLQDLVEIAQPELIVDVDMGAHVQGAARHHLAHQIGAGFGFGQRARRADLAFRLDAVGHLVARGLVRHPGQAEQGLVEMNMSVDQRRQDESTAEVDRILAGRRGRDREEGGDPPSLDLEVMLAAVGQPRVGVAHGHHVCFGAPTSRRPRPLPCGSG